MSSPYARHYARFHPDTPEHEAGMRILLQRWLGAHLPASRETEILDVGCGRGYALSWLRELGYGRLAGIDVDAGQVEFARQRGLPVTCVADTAEFLRTSGARYDLVLLMDVLEHFHPGQQEAFLQSVAGSLRPGGQLIVTVPNADSPLAAHWRFVDPTHHLLFTAPSLEFALHRAGLEISALQPVEFIARPRYLFWLPTARATQWWLLQLTRLRWRLVQIAELGWTQGKKTPLGPNLLAVARRT